MTSKDIQKALSELLTTTKTEVPEEASGLRESTEVLGVVSEDIKTEGRREATWACKILEELPQIRVRI